MKIKHVPRIINHLKAIREPKITIDANKKEISKDLEKLMQKLMKSIIKTAGSDE